MYLDFNFVASAVCNYKYVLWNVERSICLAAGLGRTQQYDAEKIKNIVFWSMNYMPITDNGTRNSVIVQYRTVLSNTYY